MQDKDSLIGKQMRGFKFSGIPGYIPSMHQYIDVIGTIERHGNNTVGVEFPNGDYWSYPYHEALDHLVEEEELTIEEILNNMKCLISKL